VAQAEDRPAGAVEALNATIRDIRTYILDLRPRRFQGDNLVIALERLLSGFKANTLIAVTFAAEAEAQADQSLTSEGRLVLFHVAQEALSNTAKHSRASWVDAHLVNEAEAIVLSLADNGRGFAPEPLEQRIGHGLVNMRDRVMALGASSAWARLRAAEPKCE
jgi:two-component system, NarL family, sensor histidine kinase DevS